MTDDERDQLTRQIEVMAEYYDKPKSEAQILLYVQALDDLPCEAVLGAMRALVRTSTFFPKVSEIRQLVEGDKKEAAEYAWMEMLREVRRVGYVGAPDLPAPTMETIRGLWGSWAHLCSTLPGEGPELLGWMKQWMGYYGAMTQRLARPELIGRDEAKRLLASLTEHKP